VDLTHELIDAPEAEFLNAESWRVHFHVPVDAERIGPLRTTRRQLKQALAAVAELGYAPHLEVETYTWGVLPVERRPRDDQGLIDGIAAEVRWTADLLEQLGLEPIGGGR
jgi:hypothetical protein